MYQSVHRAHRVPTTPTPPAATAPSVRLSRMPYMPALDGLRAVAVLAVLLYHSMPTVVPGGFLGVEVFLVISGYLITALLLGEHARTGSIDVGAFWLRRARRLLPALWLLLLLVGLVVVGWYPAEAARLRGDVLAALAYVSNWYLILGQQSYFEVAGRPPLLQHLWSLAVEEQFYLIYPVLLAVLLRVLPSRVAGVLVAGGALASAGWMAWLYDPAVDPSRVYYGTDTRVAGLLVGASLAFLWQPWRLRWRDDGDMPRIHTLFNGAGFVALLMLITFSLTVDAYQPGLYLGGLLVVALTTVALIAVVVYPGAAALHRVLGWSPLVWVGVRSYGIYLWHFPIMMLTRPGLDVPLVGVPLLMMQMTLTLVLAELSYRFVEMPVRAGGVGWLLRQTQFALRYRSHQAWQRVAVPLAGGAVLLLLTGWVSAGLLAARPPQAPSYLQTGSVQIVDGQLYRDGVAQPTVTPPAAALDMPTPPATPRAPTATLIATSPASPDVGAIVPAPAAAGAAGAGAAAAAAGAGAAPAADPVGADDPAGNNGGAVSPARIPVTATPTAVPPPPSASVVAVGDSVMLGAAGVMYERIPNITMLDAVVSRQASDVLAILQYWRDAGLLGEVVVLHTGSNGGLTNEQFVAMLDAVRDVPRVIVINVRVPRPWEGPNNHVIGQNVWNYPNAMLVDWHVAATNNPGYLYADGVHLNPAGQQAYTQLIVDAMNAPR